MANNVQMAVQGTSFYDTQTAEDAIQTITLTSATGGTWTATLAGQTTAAIAFDATAAAVQAALAALSNVGVNNVIVTGSAGGPYTVRFTGALGHAPVATMTVSNASLTGAGHAIAVAVVQTGFAGFEVAWGVGSGAVREVVYAPAASRSAKLNAAINAGVIVETASAVTVTPTTYGLDRVRLSRKLVRAPSNGDVLTFNSTTSRWEPESGK